MSRPRGIAMIVAVASLLLCDAPAHAQTAPASVTLTAAQWQADLRYLAAQMPLRHKSLYHTITPAAFQAAVAQLDADIPHLNGDEITLRLIALATLPTDSHTARLRLSAGPELPVAPAPLPRRHLRRSSARAVSRHRSGANSSQSARRRSARSTTGC